MSGTAPVRPPVDRDPTADRPFFGRQERFAEVGSTNDVVRAWLAEGEPDVCLAVADRQSAGRGRAGRTWVAPDGAALLLSLGFRPAWLAADRTWRLAALTALAMADAAEEVAGLRDRSIRLKWPNDLVVEDGGPADPRVGLPRKLAGLLGQTDGLGTPDPRVTIGLGINVAWPAEAFPANLAETMTSLHELSGGRPVDRALLLDAFLSRIEPRVLALQAGRFDVGDWIDRQLTTGRRVRLEGADGAAETVQVLGMDPGSGALVVADPAAPGGERRVLTGEIGHLRLADAPPRPRAGDPDPLRAGL